MRRSTKSMRSRIQLAAVGLLAIAPASALAQAAAGIWLDDEARAGVELKPCGDQLCGSIVWLKNPLSPEGKPWTDKLNPDESKRARPVCGLQVMGDLKKVDNGGWSGGWVYDPEEGKQFDLDLSMKGNDILVVRGFWKVKMLGETYEWKRMPADTPRCKV